MITLFIGTSVTRDSGNLLVDGAPNLWSWKKNQVYHSARSTLLWAYGNPQPSCQIHRILSSQKMLFWRTRILFWTPASKMNLFLGVRERSPSSPLYQCENRRLWNLCGPPRCPIIQKALPIQVTVACLTELLFQPSTQSLCICLASKGRTAMYLVSTQCQILQLTYCSTGDTFSRSD